MEIKYLRTYAASDFEHAAAAVAVERHQPRQVVELLEMVLLEVRKESF
jgi:hypothetical protein